MGYGIAETIPLLAALKDRYPAQAKGPRQKALLEPLIDRRLDRAGGDLGRIVEQATSMLDDRIVAERLADLARDAALSWHDPAHLRTLGPPRWASCATRANEKAGTRAGPIRWCAPA